MLYRVPAAQPPARVLRPRRLVSLFFALTLLSSGAAVPARGQTLEREFDAAGAVELRVKNRAGRVSVVAEEDRRKVSVTAAAAGPALTEGDVRITAGAGGVTVEVTRGADRAPDGRKLIVSAAQRERERVDLVVRVPERSIVVVETAEGAVELSGNVAEASLKTDTGTVRADVPLDALRYSFRWTLSRPRVYSEVELAKVSRTRGGYEVSGRFGEKKAAAEARIRLDIETARGVVLFGVKDEAAVPADLRERELTEAARAIIRSGEVDLIDSIRKVAPRLVGEYAETLPQRRGGPTLGERRNPFDVRTPAGSGLVSVTARVTDRAGRALAGLTARDFSVVEDGRERPVRDVRQGSAPYNLVLLLDVSGSVEERLDFIRKAALAFVNTANPQDRIAVISFRDDVQVVSDFTTDRRLLAERVKKIQAGGGTALYDALAYSLVETLRPLRSERTGVVVLSDGDDNRSFLTFNSVLETIVETGAVVFPLYVPSGLIPADVGAPRAATAAAGLDPVRNRYLTLTSRADSEGRRLAEISGGTYYPIRRLEQLQEAYDDVAAQLRTSYTITYETDAAPRPDARVRVRVSREGATVRLSPAAASGPAAASAGTNAPSTR
ncbi:MAG TPA: VWA domain-containing protein [Pyrinomonadaceae bacterium]|nr:VWA domain-containing protein [Pyrinomonadaceae bacterium]